MTIQSPAIARCDLCQAVISTAQASELIRHGVPCGVCGGKLTLWNGDRHSRRAGDGADGRPRPSPERRLLDILRAADPRPVGPLALVQAGIEDPGSAIFSLEQAGYRIDRAYEGEAWGERRFLGYRLRGFAGA